MPGTGHRLTSVYSVTRGSSFLQVGVVHQGVSTEHYIRKNVVRKPSNNWKQLKLDVLQRSSKGKRECDRKIERNIEMSYAEIKAYKYTC